MLLSVRRKKKLPQTFQSSLIHPNALPRSLVPWIDSPKCGRLLLCHRLAMSTTTTLSTQTYPELNVSGNLRPLPWAVFAKCSLSLTGRFSALGPTPLPRGCRTPELVTPPRTCHSQPRQSGGHTGDNGCCRRHRSVRRK